MIKVECNLVSASPLVFGKAIQTTKEIGEAHDDFEERTWMERLHQNENGEVFIPPNALKNMLAETAKYLSETVPGKGKSTFTKHFEAGIMVVEPIMLGIKADSEKVQRLRLFVPSDGKRGGKTRVWRNFPVINQWNGHAVIIVFDPMLCDKYEKIHEYLVHGGKFIGLLAFRPRNNGYMGRFDVKNFKKI